LLRVRGQVIVLQTMLWPDEVREPDFETLRDEVELRPQELQMAASLVGTMGADFDPTQFDDEYKKAVEDLIDYKRQHGGARPAPAVAEAGGAKISDLLTALQRSVEEARTGRKPPSTTVPAQRKATAKPGARKPSTRKPAAKKTSGESETPTKKAGGRSQH
jgi:DNA end-binding protein Ku